MTIWINAGELSGDIHGAELLKALKEQQPDLQAIGMGGEYLAKAGQKNICHVRELSVMGLTEIFSALPRAFKLLKKIKEELLANQVKAVILIDAPEFNFRVAKIAHELNIPVYYHIPPKVWAWRTERVNFLKKYIRKIFCILPFELDFYQKHGLEASQFSFVGNPLVDMINWPELSKIQPNPWRIGIMPGSRRAEISNLMPQFASAAQILTAKYPQMEFYCLRAPNVAEQSLRTLWNSSVPLHFVEPELRYQTMRTCFAMLAASGTAVLETALAGVPTVLAYRVSPLSHIIIKHVVKVKWAGLPSLILNREVFPECLQYDANGEFIADKLTALIEDKNLLVRMKQDMEEVRIKCGQPGSAGRVASIFLKDMQGQT